MLGSLDDPYGNRMLAAKHGTKIEYLQGGNKISNLINSLIGKDEKVKLSDVKHGDDAECKDCAKWQNDKLRNEGYATYGDAWKLGKVKEIYNGYDPEKRPSNYNVDSVRAYNKDAANRFFKEFDSRDLDTTKVYVANMFYNGSDYQEQAFNEGKGVAGTHTGAVHWNPSDGTRKGYWKNSHNISGKVHVEPFTQTQGGNRKWGVTAIYEPKEKDMLYKTKEFFKDNIQTVKRIADKAKTLKSGGKIDNTSNDKEPILGKENFEDYRKRIGKLNPSFLKDDPYYNLRGAFEGGLEPELNEEDGMYHLGSRNPKTGEILKRPGHPTWDLMLKGEEEAGYEVYQEGDKWFSREKKKIQRWRTSY